MTKKRMLTLTAIGLLLSFIGAFAFAQQKRGAEPLKPDSDIRRTNPSRRPSAEIPEHIFYGQFFSFLVSLQNAAEYESKAGLTKEQTAILEQIAKDCEREVALQDAKANKVIEESRAEVEKRKPAPPIETPPQLKQLQAERDQIILRHRDLLKEQLGPEAFARVMEVARELIKIELRSIQ